MADGQPITLDMSKAQPIQAPVTLDMSKAQPITSQTSPAAPQPSDYLTKAEDVIQGGVTGVVKSLPFIGSRADTTAAQKVGPGAAPISPTAYKTGEVVGTGLENIAEWETGDAALSWLTKLAKVAKVAPEVIALAEKYPKTAKMIHDATIGATLGATKAPEGERTKEALAGGAGGAVGGAIAEGISAGLRPLARILGLGGLTSTEAMTKAGRPYVGEQNWEENVQRVMPRLVEAAKQNPIKTVGDFEDLAHNTADTLWKTEVKPQVDRHAAEILNTIPIRDKVQAAVTPSMKKFFPEEAAEIERFAANFGMPTTVVEADADLQALNAKLKAYYKAPPEARAALLKTEGNVAAVESAAEGLRNELYTHLEQAGEDVPAELRKQYGALKQIERVFGKRATVADRQAPLDMKQVIGMMAGGAEAVGAILSGHPLAAAAGAAPVAIATAAKMRNAPESLIRQGLKTAEREATGPSAAEVAAKEGAKATSAMVGSEIGRTIFRSSDGATHSVPNGQLDAEKKIDPNLEVLQ